MKVNVKRVCPLCGAVSVIEVERKRYNAWQSGVVIQKAMSDLPIEVRETLISGMCGKCQKIFDEWEEE